MTQASPEEADAIQVVPVDDSCQGLAIFHHQSADKGQPLVCEGLEHAVPVGEHWRLLVSELHVEAGVPQVVGSGAPPEISAGILPRGKNQILMASLVHSVAYTPPPLALKPAPYDLGSDDWI